MNDPKKVAEKAKKFHLQDISMLERKSNILARKKIVVLWVVIEHGTNKKLKKEENSTFSSNIFHENYFYFKLSF
jgi:hypothetical protein